MTHEMGRCWDQPSREAILIDEKNALMTRATFLALASYDTSIPSGVYEGKMWKRAIHGGDLLCWFGSIENSNKCSINHREIILV